MVDENNLIWIDLEMTGLDISKDKILEIAVVVTDKDLNILDRGFDLVVKQKDKDLENMNDWCKQHFGESGLIKESKASKINIVDAEKRAIELIKQYCVKSKTILCGNSIHADRKYIEKYMPKLAKYFHYRMIDVSSIKELSKRWYPDVYKTVETIKGDGAHRSLDDIMASIAELKLYKEKVFVS